MPDILVTGGAGFIGSHICKILSGAGHRPVTYDNLCRGFADAVRWGPLEIGDIRDRPRLRSVLEAYRPVAVIHCASLISVAESVSDPAPYYDVNVAGSLNLLDCMRETQISRIVFSSTAAVYGMPGAGLLSEDCPTAPISPYGHSKLMGETLLQHFGRAYGLGWMALRYFNAVGADPEGDLGQRHEPATHLLPLVLDAAAGRRPAVLLYGDDYPTPDGTCIRDYIHVRDLARAHLSALDWLCRGLPSQALNLGTGTGVSVTEFISTAQRVTGLPIPVSVAPRRPGDPAVLICNAERAKRLLGWEPAFPGIDAAIAHAWRFRFPELARHPGPAGL